ncbi:MAG: type II toxin-antitoxin system VapC family toxin [Terracidiphilus sp.]
MIIDSSALAAIFKREPDWRLFASVLDSANAVRLSAATYVEISVVVERLKDPALSNEIDDLIEYFEIDIEPLTAAQAKIARQAYRVYGKGSGHPANLNFGDCFSYALARDKREPILYKGDDFAHTDLRSAMQAR